MDLVSLPNLRPIKFADENDIDVRWPPTFSDSHITAPNAHLDFGHFAQGYVNALDKAAYLNLHRDLERVLSARQVSVRPTTL